MTILKKAFTDNLATFGANKVTWQKRHFAMYYFGVLALSVASSFWIKSLNGELVTAVITAVSIFAGFAFAILLLFVDHKFSVRTDPDSIEQEALQEKLDRLADDTFSILYYFIVVSGILICLGVSYFFLLRITSNSTIFNVSLSATNQAGTALFAGFCIEIAVSFARLLRRLHFLFGKVRAQ